MSYTDYAPLLIAARKHLANAEAAAALHKWQVACNEVWEGSQDMAKLWLWMDKMFPEGSEEVREVMKGF